MQEMGRGRCTAEVVLRGRRRSRKELGGEKKIRHKKTKKELQEIRED